MNLAHHYMNKQECIPVECIPPREQNDWQTGVKNITLPQVHVK